MMRMRSFEHVMKAVQERPNKRLAIACPDEGVVLRAADDARFLKIADSVLVGDADEINAVAEENDIELSGFEIVNVPDRTEASRQAVRMVSSGQADFLMKGLVDTTVVLKAVLDKEIGLRTGSILSHVAVAELPGWDRFFLVADAGMIISPSFEQRVMIGRNTVWVAQSLGIKRPKVAYLAAIEKLNPDMPITMEARRIQDENLIEGADVSGPMALDVAVCQESARMKGLLGHDPVAGNADILIVPELHAGNIFMKGLIYFAKAKWAGIVAGARAPVIVTSRGDIDPAIRLRSIAVASLISDAGAKMAAA